MQTKETIQALLDKAMATGNWWVIGRAIVTLYQYQTYHEQITDSTNQNNGVGFNGADARWLSLMAKWYQGGLNKGLPKEKCFSEKQAHKSIKRLYKYCGQLAKIANQKQAAA